MLYLQLDSAQFPNLQSNSADDLWASFSRLGPFGAGINQKLYRLIRNDTLFSLKNITESALVNIVGQNENDAILNSFSDITWALLHIACDRRQNRPPKSFFSILKNLSDNVVFPMQSYLFLLSQFDFDVNQHADVSFHILESDDAWAQLVLLSRPNFSITSVPASYISEVNLSSILNRFLVFVEKTRVWDRPDEAEALLTNFIALGLNNHITEYSAEILEKLIDFSISVQEVTAPVRSFFRAMTALDNYRPDNVNRAVKHLLAKLNFDVTDYYEGSSEAFKVLHSVKQARWLENWFAQDDIVELKKSAGDLLADSEILRDPSIFVDRLIGKHLHIFVQNLLKPKDVNLTYQDFVSYRIINIFSLIQTLKNPHKEKVCNSRLFIHIFLWYQITFYRELKKKEAGAKFINDEERENEKISFFRYILKDLQHIHDGKGFSIVYYYDHCRDFQTASSCIPVASNYLPNDLRIDFSDIKKWLKNIILYNSSKSNGSHAARILACLPDKYLTQIFGDTISYVNEVREKGFPGKNVLTAEKSLELIFSASWSRNSSAASSRSSSPQSFRSNTEVKRSSSFSERLAQSVDRLTPSFFRPPSRQNSQDGSSKLFKSIAVNGNGIANEFSTPISSLATNREASTPGYIRHPVDPDGNCGYTAFGINRNEAFSQLSDNIEAIRDIIQLPVKQALLTEEFCNYLTTECGFAVLPETMAGSEDSLCAAATNMIVQHAYIKYDVLDKVIDQGWVHPKILQALALINKIELRMWILGDHNILVPHCIDDENYGVYRPPIVSSRVDLLFVNRNHFERLEYIGYGSSIPDQGVYPLNSSRNLASAATTIETCSTPGAGDITPRSVF